MQNDGKCHFAMENLPIQRAALRGDWDLASKIFDESPHLMTKQITCRMAETPLVLAIKSNKSNRFIKKLVERIVKEGAAKDLFMPTFEDNTPLHYAAKVGNKFAAELLVEQNDKMTHAKNKFGNTPLDLAAWHGKKDTLVYLLSVTPDKRFEEEGTSPYTGVSGGNLITLIINAGFVDVALQVVNAHWGIVKERNQNGKTALEIIATKPDLFAHGSLLDFWERCFYSLIPVTSWKETTQDNICFYILNKLNTAFWSCVRYMVLAVVAITKLHDTKRKHIQSQLLVKKICEILMEEGDYFGAWKTFVSALTIGVEHGTFEVIMECISKYPDIVSNHEGRDLFLAAIKQRRERVYNLMCQLSGNQAFTEEEARWDESNDGNALHIAARLAPTHRLTVVTGAPLQLQRELQWFKEIEKNIEPSYREAKNRDGETPKQVFTREHQPLLKDAQEWMKSTSESCTVVAALIITMAFAAAFTAPGGNQDNGKPLFLDKGSFMIFIIADAVALFSSCTSVLMFLGILTSRFAEDDFLYALPKRLTIGLLSLFLSLAATLIAFSATLALVLEDKVTWIVAPLVIATSVPVCLFGLLQFPLLVELISNTYGRGIFHQKSHQKIH